MSHYCALAVLPANTEDLDAAVDELMRPHQEDWDDDHTDGWWDWFQIGGRFTGWLDGYDPEADPANIDENGDVKWPTQWVRWSGDVARWADVADRVAERPPFTVVYLGGVAHRKVWDGNELIDVDQVPAALAAIPADAIVVVVDYHSLIAPTS